MQLIKTKHHGTLKVIESYQIEGMHIAKTEAGYVHLSGLPVASKDELKKCVPPNKLKEALDWWDRRFEEAGKAPKCIMLDPKGRLFFEDGKPVTSADEIDASIEPGPAREAMRQAFYVQQAREQEEQNILTRTPAAKAPAVEPPKPKSEPKLARVDDSEQPEA